MNCESVRERLQDLIDGELPGEEAAAVLEHLEACPSCREHHDDLVFVVDAVRGIPWPEPPEDFAERVRTRLEPPSRPFARLFWMAPVAAAACLLLLVALNPRLPAPETVSGGREVARSAEARDEKQEGGPRTKPGGELARRDAERASASAPLAEAEERDASPGAGQGGDFRVGDPAAKETPSGRHARPGAAAPAEPAPPSSAPAPGRPGRGGEVLRVEVRPEVDLFVTGLDPDAAAGTVLAELGHRRARQVEDRGASAPAPTGAKRADRDCEERVLTDEAGDPAGVILCVTEEELDFVRTLLSRRRAVALERLPEEDAGSREKTASNLEDGRRKVRILFAE